MVFSRRERYVGIIASAVLVLLALDRFIAEPLLAQRDDLGKWLAEAQMRDDRERRLISDSRRMGRSWAQMADSGLQGEVSSAESQMLHNINEWARAADLNLPTIKPDRTEREKDFTRITFRANGTGSMKQIRQFLERAESAKTPAQIVELQIATRKEGTDDQSVTLGIATIALTPPTRPGETKP